MNVQLRPFHSDFYLEGDVAYRGRRLPGSMMQRHLHHIPDKLFTQEQVPWTIRVIQSHLTRFVTLYECDSKVYFVLSLTVVEEAPRSPLPTRGSRTSDSTLAFASGPSQITQQPHCPLPHNHAHFFCRKTTLTVAACLHMVCTYSRLSLSPFPRYRHALSTTVATAGELLLFGGRFDTQWSICDLNTGFLHNSLANQRTSSQPTFRTSLGRDHERPRSAKSGP